MTTLPTHTPIESVKTSEPVVALTFDDGPHATHTAWMLELFARENIKVTFFEIGNAVVQFPALAKAVIAAGHEIGNHSMTHPNLGEMTDVAAIRAEILDSQDVIHQAAGYTPVIFRAPLLAHGPALWTVLDELNLPSINGIHAADWDASTTKESIVETYSNVGPGDIILLHSWPAQTMEALPEIIHNVRAKGFRFVTISELITLEQRAT